MSILNTSALIFEYDQLLLNCNWFCSSPVVWSGLTFNCCNMNAKILGIVLVLSLTASIASNAQWNQQLSNVSDNLMDVYFSDNNTGFVTAQAMPYLLKTIDGGSSWNKINIPSDGNNALWFINSNVGYVAGASLPVLMKTTDGGLTWTMTDTGTGVEAYDICFSTSDTGIITGGYNTLGRIIRTTDAGSTWNVVFNTFLPILSVSFSTANTGYAVGMAGVITKTTDAGATWTQLISITNKNLASVFFIPNTTVGYAAGEGVILKTMDGENWTNITPPNAGILFSVYFTDVNTGYAAGQYGSIYSTNDGGSTWILNQYNINGLFQGVFFSDASHGWAVGDHGSIYKYSGGVGLNETGQNNSDGFLVYPNPAKDRFTAEIRDQNLNSQLIITDFTGRVIITHQIKAHLSEIDISNLTRGCYFVNYVNERNIVVRRIIKI